MKKPKILVVLGPTATGKSGLGVEKKFYEILSEKYHLFHDPLLNHLILNII